MVARTEVARLSWFRARNPGSGPGTFSDSSLATGGSPRLTAGGDGVDDLSLFFSFLALDRFVPSTSLYSLRKKTLLLVVVLVVVGGNV